MCLSNAYEESDQTLLMRSTSRITTDGDELVLRDLFGSTVRIRGIITAVDFEKNTVTIRCT